MGHVYAVLGAGMQGTAAAYDMLRFGDADRVVLLDLDLEVADQSARRINALLGVDRAEAAFLDARDAGAVEKRLAGVGACLSALPYTMNPSIAAAAIAARCHMCDLGGNTAIVRRELDLDADARRAGVSVVPDCGLAPGLANILAAHGIGLLDTCDTVRVRCGGLPVHPRPPLGYKLVFNIAGLTNEYFGRAAVLRDGRVMEIDTFTELEDVEFPPPIGRLEAFVTSGGSSTCPWTFRGRIRNFDYKTLRYPGHYEKFRTIHELGLLDLQPIELNGRRVTPREVFHAVAAPRITFPNDPDLVVLRVTCDGERSGRRSRVVLEVIDRHDVATGFTAMERTTAFPASIVAIMMARRQIRPGATSLEVAVPTGAFLTEFRRRDVPLEIREEAP